MSFFATPEFINERLSLSSTDSTFLCLGVRSGLIEIPGDCDRFFRLLRTVTTSWDLTNLTMIGRSLLGLYFPSLKQSRTAWGEMDESTVVRILHTSERSFDSLLNLGVPLVDSFKPKISRLYLRSLKSGTGVGE